VHSCTKQLIQQEISVWEPGMCTTQDKLTLQARFCSSSRCLPAMVRLHRPGSDKRITALRNSIGKQEL
jgi:hypothetical protein